MRLRSSVVAVAGALIATAAGAADPALELRSGITRLQQAQPALRQGLADLRAAPAAWDERASRWQRYVQDLEKAGGAIDPNALVQEVLRESYLQTVEDLRFYAEKVKYYNTQKKLIRDYLQKLRDADARMRAARAGGAPPLRVAGLEQAVGKLHAQDSALGRIHAHLERRAARLKALSPRDTNIIAILIGLLRESIKEMNEDKTYYLEKLQELTRAADALAAELKAVADASATLATEEREVKDSSGSVGQRRTRP
jgi:hypothetical protein